MTVVLDASVVVSALGDTGEVASWAKSVVASESLLAPHPMPVEAAHVLRKAESAGDLSSDVCALAHQELVTLPVELFPYSSFAMRVWELRHAVTAYDAWYVAIAESTGARLATLDRRLARAPGPRCEFLLPRG